ncbi:MAG: 3-hydroxybutyrate dehydrogenase [Acidocella sp. 20-57-95]|nr:MAG: 3-hydroxybutyrate dehydrogenase [Acidocella sp. 20-57-95]OYV61813.1 MAG: 3-hydroxybutyrate dehydrogenase [Acidocella sp. 21-58-7]HQT65060.1 3-hydroxybutyrate dehydrogenase [Acidocella sp.]HQU04124.1 3-hydroxybutyrate dehydrogenase [Acidocella sp.]
MALKGKVALVTGSTSGIGLGIARALAAEGADIMLNGFGDAAMIEKLRSDLAAEFSVKVAYDGADLSKPDQVAAIIAKTQSDLGSLDILVNNAGIQYVAAVEEFPEAKWDAIIAINLSAVFYGMKYAIPGMKAKKWGRIINIASAHGLVGSPHKVAYVAAKHGVVGATKVAAIETANDGITVNAICPGWVLTPLVEAQLEDRAKAAGTDVPTEEKKMLAETQPMLQFTKPEQIAALAVFLCSEGAGTMTGQPISIDGGWVSH